MKEEQKKHGDDVLVVNQLFGQRSNQNWANLRACLKLKREIKNPVLLNT